MAFIKFLTQSVSILVALLIIMIIGQEVLHLISYQAQKTFILYTYIHNLYRDS